MPRSTDLPPLARRLAAAAFGAIAATAVIALILQARHHTPPAPTSAVAVRPATAAVPPHPIGPVPASSASSGATQFLLSQSALDRLLAKAPGSTTSPTPARSVPKRAPKPATTTKKATAEPAAAKAKAKTKTKAKAKKPTKRAIRPFGTGSVTRSHYLRHLVDGPADLPRMRALGARDARHNRSGQPHVVLLDIGGQTGGGVLLSTTTRWVSYPGLANAVIAYAQGYHANQRANAPVTIAIGTNNDLAVSYDTGRQWAQQVVQPVANATKRYAKLRIAGANDIEPGFRAGPGRTQQWMRGFLSATPAPLVFNGSADGCSPTYPDSRCQHGWTARDLAWMAGVAAPKRITALPQIYNTTMAQQWAMISLTAAQDGSGALHFHGPLTENGACRGKKHCPTMNSGAAWRALWDSLRISPAIAPKMLPTRSDLDVH